ncbi:MAG: hypothetical protein QXL96_12425, partial [Ignisphaera sp.]
ASEAVKICTKICEKIKEYYRDVYEREDDADECDNPIETPSPYDCNDCDVLCENMMNRTRDLKAMIQDIPKIVKPKS